MVNSPESSSTRQGCDVDSSRESDAADSLLSEIKALRDASESLMILLDHIWRNQQDLRCKVSAVLTDQGRQAIEESLCCYECGSELPESLAQALYAGWIDITYEAQSEGVNFVGWCPHCQREHEAKETELNDAPSLFDETAKPAVIGSEGPASRDESGSSAPLAGDQSQFVSATPSQRYNAETPLLTRLYLHRHMEAIVRAIGYAGVPHYEATARLRPIIQRFGAPLVESAIAELLEEENVNGLATVRLRSKVMPMVRQILGPPP